MDAISLLWRLDMAGFPQDRLWKKIKAYLQQHPYEQYIGLNNVHFIYCLARLGDDEAVIRALNAIEAYINTLHPGNMRQLWMKIVLPFCKGVAAYVKGQYSKAIYFLSPIIKDCFQMGGSDAQNDLFLQTYLLCLLKTNKQEEAKLFFDHYLSYYRNTPLAEFWFTPCSQ